ncbi:MAG: hypothetical protein QHI38_07470 [Armatimonadota bacterium]|nr:hypothetical protein [Armatimonadota bacterium]
MRRLFALSVIAISLVSARQALGLTILSPAPDQVVREYVKISIPLNELPPEFVIPKGEQAPDKGRPFLTLYIGSGGQENFVAAISGDAATVKGNTVTFYWDSKAPYRDPQDPKVERYYKDGPYTLKIQLHDSFGKIMDSASVNIILRNKIPRSNPAPPVRLVHKLSYGESHTYRVRASVQVFETVGVGKSSGIGLPILGGLGLTSDSKVILSVEDVRPDGIYMLRLKMGEEGYVSSFGKRQRLYQPGEPTPELYRLVDKYGNVIKRNMFSRQAKYSITDILPILPRYPVVEGDSWPSKCNLKIEGITDVIPLTGTSQLDSFEWQSGRECAKILSALSGASTISIDNGRIRSTSDTVTANAVTYFAYKTGKLIRSEITLEFPALIMPGAGQLEGAETTGTTTSPYVSPTPSPISPMPEPMMDGEPFGPYTGRRSSSYPAPTTTTGSTDYGQGVEMAKKGTVQIRVVVQLEK